MASELGTSSAAPMPCSARATFSTIAVGAMAQATEAAVNSAKPVMKVRREPNLSPSAPADSRNTAKPSV
ncbi:hypothetical protein RugamoR1_04100 [Rugamonas sp. R1(2021)]